MKTCILFLTALSSTAYGAGSLEQWTTLGILGTSVGVAGTAYLKGKQARQPEIERLKKQHQELLEDMQQQLKTTQQKLETATQKSSSDLLCLFTAVTKKPAYPWGITLKDVLQAVESENNDTAQKIKQAQQTQQDYEQKLQDLTNDRQKLDQAAKACAQKEIEAQELWQKEWKRLNEWKSALARKQEEIEYAGKRTIIERNLFKKRVKQLEMQLQEAKEHSAFQARVLTDKKEEIETLTHQITQQPKQTYLFGLQVACQAHTKRTAQGTVDSVREFLTKTPLTGFLKQYEIDQLLALLPQIVITQECGHKTLHLQN